MSAFVAALAAGPIVLDGGLGTLLEAHGHDMSSSLWSARLLLEDPDAIRRAHREYFGAGARVAITSSYQVSHTGLAAAGFDRADVERALRRSVELARQARVEAGLGTEDAWIAASVGPYGASLADGSEYTGAYGRSVDELREWHRPRLAALVASEPDVLAIETVPSLVELEAITAELDGIGIPAWVSVTVADGRLRAGDALEDAFVLAAGVPEVVAAGVNCCDTAEVAAALAALRASGGELPAVVYPNSGELWHAQERAWSGSASEIAAHAGDWVADGARLIGGCCRVGPDQIAAVARRLVR